MKSLLAAATAINEIDVDELWNSMVYSKTLRLNSDNTIENISGNDKSGSSKKRGIYRHVSADGELLYVGKGEKMSIGARQNSHFYTFRNPHSNQERTGVKYRKLISDRGLQSLDIVIEYLDMTNLPVYLIPMVELMLIENFQPLLNNETES